VADFSITAAVLASSDRDGPICRPGPGGEFAAKPAAAPAIDRDAKIRSTTLAEVETERRGALRAEDDATIFRGFGILT
jgi:hypothetical protein